MYKKIIVPVDMGQIEKGQKILSKAKALLDDGGQIILINIAESVPGYLAIDLPADFIDSSVREANAKLVELNAACGTDARVEVRVGSAAREIIAASEDHAADLIIIASHRPDFSNYLLGATADRVVRHAKCAVLVDR